MTSYDAAIIGAGPAGSVAARLLAKGGWRVALIEKSTFPRRKVCGEFISAATLPLLDDCGIGRDFMTMAGPKVTHVALYAGRAMPEAPLPSQGGRALGREHLDTLLRDAAMAAGAELFQPAELKTLLREGDIYKCTLDGADDIEARIVIAACGSWSTKGPFALDAPPAQTDLLAFKAHFKNSQLPPGLMPLLAFPGGYGGMVHENDGLTSLSCCLRRDWLTRARARRRSPDASGRAADAVFAHIADYCDGAARALDGAVLDGAPLAAGPIRPGIRARYRDGIFFTGNLAGEAHPVIAEGISMAVQSSTLLARILIAQPDIEKAGALYARRWHRRFAPRIHASRLFARMAMTAPLRVTAANVVKQIPALLTFGARLAGKAV